MIDNSGTSGSMQSSSGGDEDQESHGYTTSMVSNNFGPRLSNPNNDYLVASQQDCFSSHNTINSFSLSSSFPGLDQVWSRSTLPSGPNSTSSTLQNLVGLGSSSSVITPNSSFVAQANHTSFPSSSFPMLQQPGHHQDKSVALPEKPAATRKPKKRNRASKRSSTTVMVTDTANFRSMVQEFTGIPAPPFAGSPYSSSRRLDWFGAARGRSSTTSSNLEQVGSLFHHSVRPTAYKPITNPLVSSSSLPNINVWDSSVLQNPNLSFQSLLQSPDIGTSVGSSSREVPVVGPNKSQVNSMYNDISLGLDARMLDQNIRQQENPASSDLGGNYGREQF